MHERSLSGILKKYAVRLAEKISVEGIETSRENTQTIEDAYRISEFADEILETQSSGEVSFRLARKFLLEVGGNQDLEYYFFPRGRVWIGFVPALNIKAPTAGKN